MTHLCFPTCFSRLFCFKKGGGGENILSPINGIGEEKHGSAREERKVSREREKGLFRVLPSSSTPLFPLRKMQEKGGGGFTRRKRQNISPPLSFNLEVVAFSNVEQGESGRRMKDPFIPEFQAHDGNHSQIPEIPSPHPHYRVV